MLKNDLTIALRRLRRQPVYATINVVGLAVGMACCLLILLLVRHEWRYDAFHADADRIHRILIREVSPDGEVGYRDKMPPAMAASLQAAFPGVERAVQFVGGPLPVRAGDETVRVDAYLADSTLFETFSFPLVAGDAATALDDPRSVVMTEAAVARCFGERAPADVLGETLTVLYDGEPVDVTVTGVAENVPATSSLIFDVVLPFRLYQDGTMYLGGNDWGGRSSLYVRLAPGETAERFEEALRAFTPVALGDRIAQRRTGGYLAAGDDAFRLVVQPLRRVHLQPELGVSYERPPYDPAYGYVLSGMALLILLIACINFVTLSLGRSAGRAREVGLRKALGAGRAQVARQFWSESLLLSTLAFGLGVLLAQLALPLFNTLTQRTLALDVLAGGGMLGAVLGLVVLVGLLAGGYPSLVLSRFTPSRALRGDVRGVGRSGYARGLVVAQYAISVVMIVGALVMARQMDYLRSKDLGFRDEGVIAVQTGAVSTAQAEGALAVFRNELRSDPAVQAIVRTGYAFTYSSDTNGWQDAGGRNYEAHMIAGDYDFVEVMGMQVVAGRDFDPRFPSDSTRSVLVNEAFVRTYGLDDPVGHRLDGFTSFFEEAPEIVGVVADFHFRSLHEPVAPAVLNMHPDYYGGMQAMLVKVGPENLPATIARLEAVWAKLFPSLPFRYSFVDEDMDRLYAAEERWGQIVFYAALFAIGIACLGLFGLAALTAARRTKEVGVRKVLGASAASITLLFTSAFAKLVLAAFVLAAPVAYLAVEAWLDGFAYRVALGPGPFLLAGALAVGIALLTVSLQSVRIATADPVKALRYE